MCLLHNTVDKRSGLHILFQYLPIQAGLNVSIYFSRLKKIISISKNIVSEVCIIVFIIPYYRWCNNITRLHIQIRFIVRISVLIDLK